MILLVLVASVLIAAVTLYQYNEQSKDYHKQRLERKEAQLLSSINYVIRQTTWPRESQYLDLIFKEKIYEIADNLNVEFNIYDLGGTLVKSSTPSFEKDTLVTCMSVDILNNLMNSVDKRFVESNKVLGGDYRTSYTIFTDFKSKPLGILNVPYFEDDSFNEDELREF